MPRLAPYAAHEIAILSSTPAGSGLPIGLMPGALPSDHASRQTLKTTAMRLPPGHVHCACFMPTSFDPESDRFHDFRVLVRLASQICRCTIRRRRRGLDAHAGVTLAYVSRAERPVR